MEAYYYNNSTVIKYLRKVLNIINSEYVDNGIRAAFIMKKYVEHYNIETDTAVSLVFLAFLKDIGSYDKTIAKDDVMKKAISGYTFLKYCSPIKDKAKPILFCGSLYNETIEEESYQYGLLINLIDRVANLIYLECSLEEIKKELLKDTTNRFNPKHIKQVLTLLASDEKIMSMLDQKNSLYIHETCSYIQNGNYSEEQLKGFINMVNYIFEFHNKETIAHSITTSVIARALAKLSRLSETQVSIISIAALVHDIGKVKIPAEILGFPGKLSEEDYEIMKTHSTYTKEILEGCFSYQIVEIAYRHHEKLDGSGYPLGLKAIDLTIGDKIIGVADFISALRAKRCYKERMSIEEVLDELHKNVHLNRFDQRLVRHFENNYEEITKEADEKESEIVDNYKKMKDEASALQESAALAKFFGLEE